MNTTVNGQPQARTLCTRLALLTPEQQERASILADYHGGSDSAWRKALAEAELPILPAGVPVEELTVRVQTDACSRCGGSGRYSWCQMYGDRCFGCNGSGQKATKLGAAASEALNEWRDTVGAKLPRELTVGDRYMSTRMNGSPVVRTLVAIEDATTTRSKQGSEAWEEHEMVTLVSMVRLSAHDEPMRHAATVYANKPVRLPLTGDLWAAYVAFAATVPGVVIAPKAVQA